MTTPEINVYPVGVLADLRRLRGRWKYQGLRAALRQLAHDRKHWNYRSAWNGYLAEMDGPVPRAARRRARVRPG